MYIYTRAIGTRGLTKRAMLMQLMVPSGSVVLCLHSLQMFNEVPLLPTFSGSIKAEGTVENALRPEKQP